MTQFFALLIGLMLVADPANAGPVGGAIATAATFLKGTTIVAMLARTALTFGLSALARAAMKPDAPKQTGITKEITTQGEEIPFSFILGRTATNGHHNCPPMVYQTDGNPNEWLVYVIELSDLPISGYGKMWVDGEECTFKTDPRSNLSLNNAGATVNGKYDGKVFVRLHNGNQTAADTYLVNTFSNYPERPWSSNMVLRGVAYMVVTIKGRLKDKVFSGGYPEIRIEIDGAPLFDPRTRTTRFTDNPMVIAWNIVKGLRMSTGDVWGYDVEEADIVEEVAIAAMNACDELVDIGNGQTEKRYRAGLEISVDKEPAEVLQHFLNACCGNFADMGGEVLLTAGPPTPSVFAFTDANIILTNDESFSPFPGMDGLKNAVHCNWPDPEKKWESREAVPLYNPAWEAQDGGRRLVEQLNLIAVPFKRQVRRVMREMAADHRRHRNHMITLGPEAGAVKLLDTITWTVSQANGYVTKLFEVNQKSVHPWTGFVTLQIRERDPSDYNPNVFLDGTLPSVTPDTTVIPVVDGVTGLTAVAVNAANRPGIRINWHPEIDAQAIAWVIRLASNNTILDSGSTTAISDGFVVRAPFPHLTDVLVQARIIANRDTVFSANIPVKTLDLRFGPDDLTQPIRDALDDFADFQAEIPGLIDDALDRANDAYQLAIDNLNIAKNYADTGIERAVTIINSDMGQLVARLDRLTAVATSNNFLVNGDFADGATGWTGVTVANGKGTVTSAGAAQTFDFTFEPGFMLQWRVEASGPAGSVRVQFYNGSTAIGSEIITSFADSATMKILSAQHAIPSTATRIRFRIIGTGVVIDNAAVTTIDQATFARIESLELVVANDQQALANLTTNVNARFQDTNERVLANASALLNVYTKAEANQAIAEQIQAFNATLTDRFNNYATAGSVSLLSNRVTNTEDGLRAQSERIDTVNANVNNIRGSGYLRMSAIARPSDASARVAFGVVASTGSGPVNGAEAGMYMDAVSGASGSTSRILIKAQTFGIVTGPADAPRFPFVVSGSDIVMDADVWIKELSIGPDRVKVDGMSDLRSYGLPRLAVANSTWQEVGRGTFTSYQAGTKLLVTGQCLLSINGGTSTVSYAYMRVLINDQVAFQRSVRAIPNGQGSLANDDWISIVCMRRAVAGTNTVVVQFRTTFTAPNGASGSIDSTNIYVTEFKR